jgi:hypothetical protein
MTQRHLGLDIELILLDILVFEGTPDTPLFTQFLPATSSDVQWGTGNPPGGPGECPMQMNGVFYNRSCNSVGNYTCEEKPLPAGDTTTMYVNSWSLIK